MLLGPTFHVTHQFSVRWYVFKKIIEVIF